MLEIVNVVGSGSIGEEVNLEVLASSVEDSIVKYDPEKYPGLYLRFDEDGPLTTLYRTGKFIITGGSSVDSLEERRDKFLNFLDDLGIVDLPIDDDFFVQNIVAVGQIDQQVNLNALAIGLGLEDTEYEPEQFPGLVYRPDASDVVCLLFSSGKVVITGSTSVRQSKESFSSLKDRISNLI